MDSDDSSDAELALGRVLTVVHRCWHAERYPVTAFLSAEAQRAFAYELAKELCPRCVAAEQGLTTAA